MTAWTALMSLIVLVLTISLSACGSDSAPAASSSGSTGSTSAAPTTAAPAAADATAVSISEQTGGQDIYSFAPATLSIKAGGAVKFTNNSDENHELAITPAGPTAGTVTKSGSNDNTLMVTFPTAGTFTVTSQLVNRLKDGQHTPDPADSKATLMVTVS